jgi:hypothetical protein
MAKTILIKKNRAVIPATQEQETGGSRSKSSPNKSMRPCLKNNQSRMAGGVAQAVERLPSKHKFLSSNPCTGEK